MFKGEKLNEYDYWKYQINGVAYFIPKPPILVKFLDFDSWARLNPQFRLDANSLDLRKEMTRKHGTLTRILKEIPPESFPPPNDPSSKVLDMGMIET